MKQSLSLALASFLCVTSAQAFEVNGGSVSLGYSSFVGKSNATDVNKLAFGASLEFGITQQFALQTDFSIANFGLTDLDNTNLAVHGIGHLNEQTSVGAYVGKDRLAGIDQSYFGFEVGHQMNAFGTEAYVTFAEDDGSHGTVLGFKGDYKLGETSSVGAKFDNLNVEGFDATRVALTGEMGVAKDVTLTGEVGSVRFEDVGSESYVGIGLKMNFGAKRGATFDRRSLIDLLPGL